MYSYKKRWCARFVADTFQGDVFIFLVLEGGVFRTGRMSHSVAVAGAYRGDVRTGLFVHCIHAYKEQFLFSFAQLAAAQNRLPTDLCGIFKMYIYHLILDRVCVYICNMYIIYTHLSTRTATKPLSSYHPARLKCFLAT